MWAITAAALATLRASHTVAVRATAYTPGGEILTDVPLTGGVVTADAKSQVRRTASVTVGDPTYWSTTGFEALSPVGTEMAIEFGIVIPGVGPEWIPLIHGPIQKITSGHPRTEALTVDIADRSKAVADARLDSPTQTRAGYTCVQEITRLIRGALPDSTVLDLTGNTAEAPALEIDKDPWADGVEKLADAIGAEVYADPIGRFIIRSTPVLEADPVWVVDSGATGVLIKANLEATRERVYNAVIATGERVDGASPVWAKVVDYDPTSPTFYGGPFGKKPRFYSSPLLRTTDQATLAAEALLARVRGYSCSVTVEAVPNPALEPGDVVEVRLPDGTRQRHICDKVPIPLAPGASQALETRSAADLPAES